MRRLQTLTPFSRIFLSALVFVLGLFVLVALIHLISGWQTLHQYGNGLVWGAVIGCLILLVSAGWRNGRREEQVVLSKLMREHDVFYLLNRDNDGRARFLFAGVIAVIITLVVGLILLRVS